MLIMTDTHQDLAAHAQEMFGESITAVHEFPGQLTLDIRRERIVEICRTLRDDPAFAFEQLMDVCGVDYLDYDGESPTGQRKGPRFAAVYHLLSLRHNRRLCLRAYLDDESPMIASVTGIWNSANWY